ncbi:MAG TPA: hypothetical protein EYP85_01040 [Armatimonadetes bacterium]|nr:hypothetical protein [Armatimonadota bacterium]
MYRYKATVVRVVDGDTLDVDVDLGFYVRQRMRLRLRGINAPELRGPERARGLEAKAFVAETLSRVPFVAVRTYKIGKYGRYIADVYFLEGCDDAEEVFARGQCLNDLLVEKGLAEPLETRRS